MTLDDLERPIRTLAEKSFYGAHQKNLNADRRRKMYISMILVSRNISGYSLEILAEGASNDSRRVSTNFIKQISRRFQEGLNPGHICLASASFVELKYP